MDLQKLQELLSLGQWHLGISGQGVLQPHLGPDRCKEFIVNDRGRLSFSHARWICIYDSTDRTIEMDENGCVLEIIPPSGHKKIHRWSRVAA